MIFIPCLTFQGSTSFNRYSKNLVVCCPVCQSFPVIVVLLLPRSTYQVPPELQRLDQILQHAAPITFGLQLWHLVSQVQQLTSNIYPLSGAGCIPLQVRFSRVTSSHMQFLSISTCRTHLKSQYNERLVKATVLHICLNLKMFYICQK